MWDIINFLNNGIIFYVFGGILPIANKRVSLQPMY